MGVPVTDNRNSIVAALSWRLLVLLAAVSVTAGGLHWIWAQWRTRADHVSAVQGQADLGAAQAVLVDSGADSTQFQTWSRAVLRDPAVLLTAIVGADGQLLAQAPADAIMLAELARSLGTRRRCGPMPLTVGDRHVRVLAAVSPLVIAPGAKADRAVVLLLRDDPSLDLALLSLSVLAPSAVAVIGMWVGTWWLRRNVGVPLAQLTEDAGENTAETWEELTRRDDELGRIASRLHAASQELGEQRDHVGRLERSLDHRVADQTRHIHAVLKRTEKQVWVDPLTQLGNRRMLDDRLEELFAAQQAAGGDLAVIMFDVDHFKQFNDSRGHGAGDELLRFIGELLRGSLRASDIAIRYGGDEFAVLLADVDARTAVQAAERIVRLFEQRTTLLRSAPPVTLSAGVASLRGDNVSSGAALLALADQVLYGAKRAGKNFAATRSELAAPTSSPARSPAIAAGNPA